MNKGAKSKKVRVSRGDLFINRVTGGLVRVMASTKAHRHFGDLEGHVVARPFHTQELPAEDDSDELVETWGLAADKNVDITMHERDCIHVRPSCVTVVRGELQKSVRLRARVDVPHCRRVAEFLLRDNPDDPRAICIDDGAADGGMDSLEAVLSKIPVFADELPLAEQAMVDWGNEIEASPIVHPKIAGRAPPVPSPLNPIL
jgi:hypothetical protein